MMTSIDLSPAFWLALAPELMMIVGAMFLLMLGVFGKRDGDGTLVARFACLILVCCIVFLASYETDTRNLPLGGTLTDDSFARFAKIAILVAALASLALSFEWMRRANCWYFEYPILVLFATAGMTLMVSASDLIVLYVSLELQALSLYVLTNFERNSARSTEAGLKYFVLGALSSGLLLFGASLLYGHAGATEFHAIAESLAHGPSTAALIGVVLLCAGLAFKVSAVPFHMWTPDVYEGAPTPVTSFLATGAKVAAIALFARILLVALGNSPELWQQILIFLSAASMLLGAIAGLTQKSLKRLMAYSSIGHMGYALMGLAANTEQGVSSLLIYMAIYLTMNIGMFAWLTSMRRPEGRSALIADLAGLSRSHPMHALALTLLLFSLAGIPPLAGFFGKFYVFVAVVDSGLVSLAIIGAIASVIAAFYYLRIVKLIYVDELDESLSPLATLEQRTLIAAAALLLVLGWLPGLGDFGLIAAAEAAGKALF